jgi:hypothetical protein
VRPAIERHHVEALPCIALNHAGAARAVIADAVEVDDGPAARPLRCARPTGERNIRLICALDAGRRPLPRDRRPHRVQERAGGDRGRRVQERSTTAEEQDQEDSTSTFMATPVG